MIEENKKSLLLHTKHIDKDQEKMQDLEGAIELIRKKFAFLESKQLMLATEFTEKNSVGAGIEQGNNKKLLEMAESVKNASSIIYKENAVLKKYFDETKNSLENELQKLRSENELVIKEFERMYGKNREMEVAYNGIKEEFKGIIEYEQKNKFNKTKEPFANISFTSNLNSTNINNLSINSGNGTFIGSCRRQPSKDFAIITPKQPLLDLTRTAPKVSVRARRFKESSNISDYVNLSTTERDNKIEIRDKRSGTAYGKMGITNEKPSLNRFKMLME